MEVSASGCSRFCIDSLLSLRPPGALLSRPDAPELSPGCSSGSSPPPSPRAEPAARLEPAPLPADPRQLQPRAASFLIRDILADCRQHSDPDQVHSDPDQVHSDPGRPETEAGPEEDYQDKSESREQTGSSETPTDRLKRPRKARTAFSDLQLSRLETSFQNHKYLNVQDRMELAASLGLSDTQVKTWYQNRRTKWKRQSAVGLELLAEASRMFLPAHFLFPATPPTVDLYLYRGPAPLQPH